MRSIRLKYISLFIIFVFSLIKIIPGLLQRTVLCPMLQMYSTSGSRGERTRRDPPPNGRGPMICVCPKRYFSHLFLCSLRSRLILTIILIEIWPQHANK